MDWEYSDLPRGKPGYYAIMYVWDPQEGAFPGCVKWDGDKQITDEIHGYPVTSWAGPFPTAAEALSWAESHDYERL